MDKVAIINSVYEFSSTGAMTKQLYEYGKAQGYEPFVFFGRGEKSGDDHIIRIDGKLEFLMHKTLTLVTGYQGVFSNLATRRLLSALKKNEIKKVILLNIHGYYLNEKKLLEYLKKNGINTAYVTPDEYPALGKCCYSEKCERYKSGCGDCPKKKGYPKSLFFDRSRALFNRKRKAYDGFDTMTLIGPETNLAKFRESPLVKDKPMKRVSWGVDLKTYKYEIDESLYDKYGIPKDKVIILTVANYSNPRKGVKEYFFEIAKRLQDTEYHFVNVGYDGNLNPEDIPKNMTTIGYMNDQQELARIYAMSDLYLLASTADTMPLSCLISFACETPVCCFYTSGLRYLADRDNPAIRYCDDISVDSLEQIVRSTKKKDSECMNACRRLAEDEYSIEAFNQKVYEVLE
ncbi:MAG: glycosyltransferase [Lachnospiraceae bacterium]|nr:glycosyltransferase [Lachnospiraceae bacterium]